MTNNHTCRLPDAAIHGVICFRTSQVLLAAVCLELRLGFGRGTAAVTVFSAVVGRVRVLPAGAVL